MVPQALEEVRLTREIIEPTLDRVDDLFDDAYVKAQETIAGAQAAGKQASEGAVKGFFTGILKLPFDLVGTLASPIIKTIDPKVAKQLTEKDVELMAEAGKKAAEGAKTGRVGRWENPNSNNSGSISVERRYQKDGFDCVDARIVINKKRRKILDKIDEFCLDEEGNWTTAGEVRK